MGRGLARRGHRNRPHRSGLRRRGLRALARARPAGAHPDRRGRPDDAAVRRLRRIHDDRGRDARRRRATRARPARLRGSRSCTATRSAGAARRRSSFARRRLVHLRGGDPAADARRERHRRVDSAAIQEADGRLAPQHGRLEHLAQALLRLAAAVLPVCVRRPERRRLAGGARRSAPSRGSTGWRSCTAPGSTRSGSAARRATPRSSGSRRSATPGSTRASSTSRRSAGTTRRGSRTATRPAPPRGSPVRIFPTTPIGRSGSRPTGSRRCASRSVSGSTRSASCR